MSDNALQPRAPTPSKHPLLEMLAIAAPTVATMTAYTLMTFVDGLMVSRIGPEPLYVAAQGNGAIAAFVPISMVMGLLGVINTYVAQHLGAGTPQRSAAYAWNGLWIAILAWLALIPYGLLIPHLFAATSHAPELVRLESAYAQILIYGSVLTMATRGIAQYFYGLHRPMVVLIAAIVGNLSNIFFNLLFIYGDAGATHAMVHIAGDAGAAVIGPLARLTQSIASALGIPALGVPGAAVGTLVGSAIELTIPLAVFLGPRFNRLYQTRAAWRPSIAHFRDIARLGWAPSLMFGNEMVCWAIFMTIFVGSFGPDHNTAGWIALRYMHLSFMPAVGISYAVTALVGACMGMKRPDLAQRRAILGLTVTMTYMGLCALAFILFPRAMIDFFVEDSTPPDTRAQILHIGVQVMLVAAVFQLFDAMGITIIGALRGAGDTVWPGIITVILVWTFIIGVGGALTRWAPHLGSLGPWLGAALYIIALGIFLMIRFLRGRWKHINLLQHAAQSSAADTSALAPPPEPLPDSPTGLSR